MHQRELFRRTRESGSMHDQPEDGRPGRRRRLLVTAILAVVVVALAAVAVATRLFPRTPELGACLHAAPVSAPATTALPPTGVPDGVQAAVVVEVVDGDGICVQPAGPGPLPPGRVAEVRLIGVNAPGKGVCGSGRAGGFARERIGDGTPVWLEADEQDRDRYARYLRYVWVSTDGRSELFNVAAVRDGYARALPKAPNERHKGEIAEAEAAARREGGGVWRCFPWRFLRWLPVRP
jgi:micrococcal nuclease